MNDPVVPVAGEPRVGNRWRPFAIHLAVSLVPLVAVTLLLRRWFPDELFDADGGLQALQIIAAVSLILGPLLTLAVATPGKLHRVLRNDLVVIALLQAAALGWGTWTAWNNRPYALIWLDGEISAVPWSSFREEPEARARVQALHGEGHELLMVRLPTDPKMRGIYLDAARKRQSSVLFTAALYQPLDPTDEDVRKWSTRLAWRANDAGLGRQMQAAGIPMDRVTAGEILLEPVRGRYRAYILLLDATTGHRLYVFTANTHGRQDH